MKEETAAQRAARLNKQNEKLGEKTLARLERIISERPHDMRREVMGYVVDRGGPYGVDSKKAIFGHYCLHDDGEKRSRGTCRVLTRVVGGILWLNYSPADVFIDTDSRKWILDFHERNGLLF